MKYLLILALCVTSAVMVMSEGCKSNDDCEDGCCTGSMFLKNKCEAFMEEDKDCSIFGQREKNGIHYLSCPCKPGLACENTEEMEILGKKIGYNAKCVKPKAEE